jgi:putative thioredoxin
MMTSDFIIDVSEADFEYQVLTYSQNLPVVVDFWAEWCGPCKVLGPILERLANEAQGGFRLAKVNVDDNPNLALRYGVRSIPLVKAFRNGEMISEFVGAQPEPQIREFLRKIAPSQTDLALEKAQSLLDLQQPVAAEETFIEVLNTSPENSTALLGLAKSVLLQGRGEEGYYYLQDFPTSREYADANLLLPLAQELTNLENGDPLNYDNPLDAAFYNSLRLVGRGNLEAALDGLMDILREDKDHRDDQTRQIVVGLLELLGDSNPLSRQYRNELASILF